MKRLDLGGLFDALAQRGTRTTVHLSRPLDIDPGGGTGYSIERLAALVTAAAGWLAGAGVRPGDRIAVVKANHIDYVLLACAAVRLGALPAMLSGRLAPATLAVLLGRLDPALIVAGTGVLDRARAASLELCGYAPRTLVVDGGRAGALCLDDVRGHPAPAPRRRSDDAPLVVMHTSGTTGVPKLVVHSTTTLIRRITAFEARRWPVLASRRGDTAASAIAFAHGRSLAWTAGVLWLAPREALIVADPEPERAMPALRAHPPTTLEALPATYVRWQPLARRLDNPFHRVRLYVSTFDAIHPPAVRTFLAASRRRAPLWLQGWGQSETGPLTFRLLGRRSLDRGGRGERGGGGRPAIRDLGRPVPVRTRLLVVDRHDLTPVPRGRPGIVLARTPCLCLGYLGEPDRFTAKRHDGWWNTGDLAVRGRFGAIRFVDREVDLIPGLSCLELEDLIDDRIPDVLECVILGFPGRPPLPVVVTGDGRLDHAAWCRAVIDLPPLADPLVLTWDEVPRTGTGKVRRLELRARLGTAGTDPARTYGTGRWT